MKNIFFYANINIQDKSIGITKKVLSQIKTLRKMGYNVYYTAYDEEGISIFDNNDNKIYTTNYFSNINIINRYLRRWNLINTAIKYIKKTNVNFEYSYLRFHFFDKSYCKLLKELKRTGSKNIVEAHGYPYRSKKINVYTLTHTIDRIYEPVARKYIDAVAAISNISNIWGCRTIQIDNAIDLDEIKLQKKIKCGENIIRLISVSNEREYHGYKKIVKGIAEYYKKGGKRDIKVYFIGEFRESTQKLVRDLNLNNKIYFLGKKYGQELVECYNNSDLGIGALSSRADSEYGSSIKTKEYFALGLPFINGWKEYAFDDSYPYVKRFELNKDIIDLNEVIKFYDSIKYDETMQIKMRNFAEENYTWEAQFEKVFNEILI